MKIVRFILFAIGFSGVMSGIINFVALQKAVEDTDLQSIGITRMELGVTCIGVAGAGAALMVAGFYVGRPKTKKE